MSPVFLDAFGIRAPRPPSVFDQAERLDTALTRCFYARQRAWQRERSSWPCWRCRSWGTWSLPGACGTEGGADA